MKAKCKKCGEELRYPKEYEKAEIGCFKCGGQVALIPQVECFETTCPNCEKVNDFSVSDFGQQVQCFYCRQSFIFSELKYPHHKGGGFLIQ
jgi:phage FluMu protein Com